MPYKRDDSHVWWVSFTEPSGKRIRRSTGTTDRKEAEALEAKWKLESYKYIGAACREAGIEDFTIHDLRHTCAAWLVSAGAPLAEIRDLLGHSTILMTERYDHVAPDNLRTTVARFDESRFGHAGEDGARAKSARRT